MRVVMRQVDALVFMLIGLLAFQEVIAINNFATALARQSTRVVQQSHDGTTRRQCSCDEQRECIKELKTQSYECLDQCWSLVKAITNSTSELKSCFSAKESVLSSFIGCLQSNINSLIANTARRVQYKAQNILNTLNLSGRTVLQNALEVAHCIKECVLKKNNEPDGFCFDRKDCLPKVDSFDTEYTLRKCMKGQKWKHEAGDLCRCAVNAGVR